MDARDANLRGGKPVFIIRKAAPFSPFTYLSQLAVIPLLTWYWAGEALHRMELQWAHDSPANFQPLADACHTTKLALCDVYSPVSFVHGLALALAVLTIKIMVVVASMPKWPPRWQQRLLQRPALVGGIGLLITLAMILARGVVSIMAVWFVPVAWWGTGSLAVQLASIVGLIVVLRIAPHVKIAWQLFSTFTRQRTGREVTRAECPALWALIDDASRRLDVDTPTHLVLGVVPDCRLEIGKMILEPRQKVIDGHILYLGVTLSASLDEAQLRQLIEHALLRSRGELGRWIPAAEDWVESSAAFLNESKEKRAAGELGIAADPAITCWGGWLIIVTQMIKGFKAEHDFGQKTGIEQEVEENTPKVRKLLDDAALAYKKDVFHLFIVNLTCGVVCPSVLPWFSRAFAQRHPIAKTAHASIYTSPSMNDELVLLEKEWLVKTSQASTPTDCWELRAA